MTSDMEEIKLLAIDGCRFVPVAAREKRPAGLGGWQHEWSSDWENVARWIERGLNVGILLGSHFAGEYVSGVVDVEYDTPAGREQLAAFGVLDIRTPTWTSSRGEHRLFRWAGWMPPKAVVHAGDLEIRVGNRAAQSVIPPSIHPSGDLYRWIVRPSEVAIAEFPAQLLAGVGGVR